MHSRALAIPLTVMLLVAAVCAALLEVHVAGAADPPTITSVSPATGPAAGGTVVTITGTGFAAGATVSFDGVAATNVTVSNATTIVATTPAGDPGPATLVVTNLDGLGASLGGAFTYLQAAPTVSGANPSSGSTLGGTSVTITGTGFQSGAVVRFGGTAATNVVVTSATTLTATTPAHAPGAVTVQVVNTDGQSGSLASAFTYLAASPPVVGGVSPTSGTTGGGTTVTITGTGFASGATVRFGNASATAVTVLSSTQLTAITPAGSGTVDVRVTNPDGQVGQLNDAYTYISTPAPTLTSVSPNTGIRTGGTSVTLTGSGFLPGAVARFGSTNATSTVVLSPTQIIATTPSVGSTGVVAVTVTNTDGKAATLSNAFTFTTSMFVTAVSPSSGTTGGGTPVTITGNGFVPGATVRFGTSNATSVVAGGNLITAVTPARSAGTVTVQVINPGGESASLANAFTYVTTASPTVAAVTPSAGPLGGGNTVTVTGTNFNPGATVLFGSRAATGVIVSTSTQLTAIVPAGASLGSVSVTVRNTDGRDGTKSNAYAYVTAPTLTSVSPSVGTTLGGTEVTLTGTNFATGMVVIFGGTPATNVTVTSSTSAKVTTAANAAGTVSVIVQTPSGQAFLANAFTYRQPAVVSSVSPGTGPASGGTLVTIIGSGFTSGSTVTIGGASATNVTVVSPSVITAVTPARPAGSATVEVRSSDGVLATGTVTFVYQSSSGLLVGGSLPTDGVSLFVFGGGTTSQLVALAVGGGCPTADLSLWATTGGRFISYTPGLPAFVNATWTSHFAAGIPTNTPIMGYCK